MELVIALTLAEELTEPAFRKHVPKLKDWTWRKVDTIDLTDLTLKEIEDKIET